MLGEAATTEIARNKDAQGFAPNVQGPGRWDRCGRRTPGAWAKSGRKVVTRQNYLAEKPKPKLSSEPD